MDTAPLPRWKRRSLCSERRREDCNRFDFVPLERFLRRYIRGGRVEIGWDWRFSRRQQPGGASLFRRSAQQDLAGVRTGTVRAGGSGRTVWRQLWLYQEDSPATVAEWAGRASVASAPWAGEPSDVGGRGATAERIATAARSDAAGTGGAAGAKPPASTEPDALMGGAAAARTAA